VPWGVGDAYVELRCPKARCGRRLKDVALVSDVLQPIDGSVERKDAERLREQGKDPAAVYEANQHGLEREGAMRVPPPRTQYEGLEAWGEVWRFRCRCGATPVVKGETLERLVRDAMALGEHRVTLP
jgi:hypothetical protein